MFFFDHFFLCYTYFVSCNGPCALKGKRHRKVHIIIRIHRYLDDWLILAKDNLACKAHTSVVCSLMASLSFIINQEKSSLSQTQSFKYLKMLFDTQAFTAQLMLARLQQLQDSVLHLRRVKTVSARQFAAVLGQMESLTPLLPLGHLRKYPLQGQFPPSVVSSHGRMGTMDFPGAVVCVH